MSQRRRPSQNRQEAIQIAGQVSSTSTVSGTVSVNSIPGGGTVLSGNGSTQALNNGQTFTGTGVDVSSYPSVVVAVITDKAGVLYFDFSTDNTNWDSTLQYAVGASINEVHRVSVTRRYFRVRFTNNSGSNQSYLRLQALGGSQQALTSSLNSTIQADADATTVRPLDFNLMTAEGLYQNRSNTIKSGLNLDVDTGASTAAPQDLHTPGGPYTGFPSTPQAAEIVVAGADTGTVWYSYMATDADADYTFASKAVTGAGTYSLGHNIWRCNFAYFDAGAGTTVNAGNISVQSVGGSNLFCRIDAGFSESQCAAYTVPAGSAVYLDMERASLRGASTGTVDGWWWYRENGKSPRLRWPFEASAGALYFDEIDYLQKVPSLTDIMPRITYSSANNQVIRFKYRFIKVKD